jgi:hypothetical protein
MRDTAIISWLEKEPFLVQKDTELGRYGNGLHLYVESTLTKNLCRVNAAGYKDSTDNYVSFYRLFVNPAKKKIIKKEDWIMPFYY